LTGASIGIKVMNPSQRKKSYVKPGKYYAPDPPASPVMYGMGISQEVGNGGQVCWDVKAVDFSVQNVYKMTCGDKKTTFEPVNGSYILDKGVGFTKC